MLSEIAKQKKIYFLQLRASGASYEELEKAGNEYANAIAAWHKEHYPNKRFHKPSVGYLIRAL